MPTPPFIRIDESVEFTWPWSATKGLLIVTGACGGGGGGGGAFCLEGLNFHGALGGQGGRGTQPTRVRRGELVFLSAGRDGGAGGNAGGLQNGNPINGAIGKGCHYGNGGIGGQGYEEGQEGGDGPNGFEIFVPLVLDSDGEEQ